MKLKSILSTILLCLSFCFSVQSQDSAYPIDGDGIYSFLRRWNRAGDAYVKEFIDLNASRLTKNNGLELGRVYLLPPLHFTDSSAVKNEAIFATNPKIFGKRYSSISPKTNTLKNACFYIISGHGGPDPGAIGKVNGRELHEDEYAYDIALRLARNLMLEGATVYVIIQDENDGIRNDRYLNNSKNETCMGEAIPRGQVERLKQRVDKVNELYESNKKSFEYLRAISIHVDSRSKDKQLDVFFYHTQDSASKAMTHTLRDVFQQKYKKAQPQRGFQGIVEYRDLYVLRNLNPVSTLVEVGNIQNEFDRRRIILEDNRQALANWMTSGFIEDYRAKDKN